MTNAQVSASASSAGGPPAVQIAAPSSPLAKQHATVQQLASDNLAPASPVPSNPAKQATKYTTLEGIETTVMIIDDFESLLDRVISREKNANQTFQLEALNRSLAIRRNKDIKKVHTTRPVVESTARKHQTFLLYFRTFLRAALDELAKINLSSELHVPEEMVVKRVLAKESPPSPSRHPDLLARDKEDPKKEDPDSFIEAWKKFGEIGAIKAKLTSLITKFEFVDEESKEDEFARDCRRNEAIAFLADVQGVTLDYVADTQDLKKGDWRKEEIEKVKRATEEAFRAIRKQIGTTPFLARLAGETSRDLNDKVVAITREFEQNFSSISRQVNKFRELHQAIQIQKETVMTESEAKKGFEHYRDAGDRRRLHHRTLQVIAKLRQDVDEMDVGKTMDTIRDLMAHCMKASEDIKGKAEEAKKILETFDGIIKSRPFNDLSDVQSGGTSSATS